jgi:hypothetical protein
MRSTLKSAIGLGLLSLAGLLSFAAEGRAQAQPAYYYPTQGWYATTAGSVFIPAPGYYYNVPRAAAAPVYAPAAPNYATAPPTWVPNLYRPGGASRGPRVSNPPYYSSGIHSLHGRGIDSSRHGR